jgi:hypothetical protein
MTTIPPQQGRMRPAGADYLRVDDFMRDLVGACALRSALELGLVDHFLRNPAIDLAFIERQSRLDARGLHLLLDLLRANRVIDEQNGLLSLSAPFRSALKYRDLLEAKLEFSALVAPDFLDMFSTLLTQPQRFFESSRIFDLFSYERCFAATPENMASTRRWMRFTTVLTKYEAESCIDRHDFSGSRRLLDVGGNSGEFALRICKAHSGVRASILDLPVVCDIGMEHIEGQPEADRIDFIKAGRVRAVFPSGFDTVCFKSMLHDWPDAEMHDFLQRARDSLNPGGTLLIFERGMFDPAASGIPYSLMPIMLFFRSYRAPEEYAAHLAGLGMRDIRIQAMELDTPFILVTAVK